MAELLSVHLPLTSRNDGKKPKGWTTWKKKKLSIALKTHLSDMRTCAEVWTNNTQIKVCGRRPSLLQQPTASEAAKDNGKNNKTSEKNFLSPRVPNKKKKEKDIFPGHFLTSLLARVTRAFDPPPGVPGAFEAGPRRARAPLWKTLIVAKQRLWWLWGDWFFGMLNTIWDKCKSCDKLRPLSTATTSKKFHRPFELFGESFLCIQRIVSRRLNLFSPWQVTHNIIPLFSFCVQVTCHLGKRLYEFEILQMA